VDGRAQDMLAHTDLPLPEIETFAMYQLTGPN
jgi:hypothetical protein